MSEDWVPIELGLPSSIDEEVEWKRDPVAFKQQNFVASLASFDRAFNLFGLSWRPLSAKLKELGIYGQ